MVRELLCVMGIHKKKYYFFLNACVVECGSCLKGLGTVAHRPGLVSNCPHSFKQRALTMTKTDKLKAAGWKPSDKEGGNHERPRTI